MIFAANLLGSSSFEKVSNSPLNTSMKQSDLREFEEILNKAYQSFNDRDIDGALSTMRSDVAWPNGMEGGTEYGHDAVRKYWSRQWTMIDPRVEPIAFTKTDDGRVDVSVHQVVKDMSGNLLVDEMVHHVYSFIDNKIRTMEIKRP